MEEQEIKLTEAEVKKNKRKFIAKRVLKSLTFTGIVTLTYLYLCLICLPKSTSDYAGDAYYSGKCYVAEKDNSLDVYAIGNSDLYSSFIPSYLYEKQGITSYSSGVSKQKVANVIGDVRKVIKNQNIKYLLVEADFILEERNQTNLFEQYDALKFLVTPINYHVRWKHLKWYDFYKIPKKSELVDNLKGFRYDDSRDDVTPYDYMKDKGEQKDIQKRNLVAINKILNMAKDHDIKVLFYAAPSQQYWTLAKHNAIADFTKENGYDFIDFNLMLDDIGFDTTKDYRVEGSGKKGLHLNTFGAVKITEYLGNYLKATGDFVDHHGDSYYSSFDESAKYFMDRYHHSLGE